MRYYIIIVFAFLVGSASAENNNSDIEKLNQSLSTGNIKEIVKTARNSSEQLFSQFHNNSDALSALPGLESMLGFIEKLLQILFDVADKIASYLP